jgi:hypothetical protein
MPLRDLRIGRPRMSALLALVFFAAGSPASAHSHRAYRSSGQEISGGSQQISCETVRAYVSQVGLVQAKAMARANGMTATQEWRARQCLARRS